MCLTTITPTHDYPSTGTGYKWYFRGPDGKLHEWNYANKEVPPPEPDGWHVAKCPTAYAQGLRPYIAGFHVLPTVEDARKFYTLWAPWVSAKEWELHAINYDQLMYVGSEEYLEDGEGDITVISVLVARRVRIGEKVPLSTEELANV